MPSTRVEGVGAGGSTRGPDHPWTDREGSIEKCPRAPVATARIVDPSLSCEVSPPTRARERSCGPAPCRLCLMRQRAGEDGSIEAIRGSFRCTWQTDVGGSRVLGRGGRRTGFHACVSASVSWRRARIGRHLFGSRVMMTVGVRPDGTPCQTRRTLEVGVHATRDGRCPVPCPISEDKPGAGWHGQ